MTETQQRSIPSWIATQTRQLLMQRGHAWLLQGPSGLGQYSLALALARAWLCERPTPDGACGTCGSCHAIDVRTHADFCVLMPETQMLELQWPLSEKAQGEIDDKKRKPSKEVRVDAMRDAIEFSQRTSARGRGKVVLVFPAEGMNAIAANALLKTLEEPPGDARFVLATESAHLLLPTIRSRCQCHTMDWPSAQDSLPWLLEQGLAKTDAQLLLQAAGGRPEDALAFASSPCDAKAWTSFANAMVTGDAAYVKDWSAPQLLDALHKLCHDLMAAQVGAAGRFFEGTALPAGVPLIALSAWAKSLSRARMSMEHPYNAGLMQEALVGEAQTVLHSAHPI